MAGEWGYDVLEFESLGLEAEGAEEDWGDGGRGWREEVGEKKRKV